MSDHYGLLRVIGDELYYDGELVAVLTLSSVPTHHERFIDLVEYGEEVTEEEQEPAVVKVALEVRDEYHAALDDIERTAKEYAKGGLLRLTDLARICAGLKEEE